MADKTDVATLMMVTYNRLDLTKRTLNNIFGNTNRDYNLVIVDNGSEDGTIEYLNGMIERHGKLPIGSLKVFELISNKENRGIAIGRNQGLKKADEIGTDWYCTIDNDVEVPEGWLTECINILKANRAYGAIGVNMEGTRYQVIEKNGYTFQDKPQGNLGTACMVFPKTVHKMIGFFKEYNKYGLEDSDFGMRLRCTGMKLGYILRPGTHCGEDYGENSEYRQFKTEQHDGRVDEFKNNCALYYQGKLPIFVPCGDLNERTRNS